MIFSILGILGTVAFAISGALAGIEKRLDFFGVFIIALVTSIGGGTLRDLLIGNTPVAWLQNLETFYIVILSTIVAIVFRQKLGVFRTSLFLFDTIGIGIFTIIGIEKGLSIHLSPIVCIILGTTAACFGGVTRDILCNEIPVIFRKEIYATACLIGGVMFFILKYFHLNDDFIYIITAGTIIAIRILAVRFHWSFPPIEMK
ncbi:trimeric intracellular cation channel family protein [Flavobacterium sp. xlx-214]|uniref:trimeric intracellular cation channel family protein n=1 Tax=unclassified Flavobacterium TaxID=196869 RepID=UPI0013D3F5CA|nr:trimeric intracellular cation channel family protein [Flavobacterium sp. xlx-221]MBA5793987.1 trimeric intracellular cation channel family protein [Flavobacterium sp. xlx-221]QMI82644.1 trimeric intracellular cation channel family protein [Flavobacterium sp. xlx-214]